MFVLYEISLKRQILKLFSIKKVTGALCALGLITGCQPSGETSSNDNSSDVFADGGIGLFQIAANTVQCEGMGPMQCLMVNGELFYDSIDGYTHVEGVSASVYVERSVRKEPIPEDLGLYSYRRVPSPN